MLTDKELAQFIVRLKKEAGEQKGEKSYVPTDIGLRVDFYRSFIRSLRKFYEYTEEDFQTVVLERLIIEASYNPNSDKKAEWKGMCVEDWNYAMACEFPKNDIILVDSSMEAMPERPKREPRPKYERPERPEKATKEEEDVALENPFENPIDKAALETGIPAPNFETDDEFLKLLQTGGSDE